MRACGRTSAWDACGKKREFSEAGRCSPKHLLCSSCLPPPPPYTLLFPALPLFKRIHWKSPGPSPPPLPSPTGIAADLDALRDERKIFTIHNPPDKDNQPRDAVFPAELMGVRVDEDIITQVGGEGGEGPL